MAHYTFNDDMDEIILHVKMDPDTESIASRQELTEAFKCLLGLTHIQLISERDIERAFNRAKKEYPW